MNLTDVLQKLSFGPLADLSIAGEGSGEVPFEQVPRLIHHINHSLTALHIRLPLSLKTIQLAVTSGKFMYPLRAQYAQTSASTEIDKFILDSGAAPFLGDVLAVEHVYDSEKCEVGLNDRRNPTSWFTPSFDVLSMDYPVTGDTYFVEYRADHAKIPVPSVIQLLPENPDDPPPPPYYATSVISINLPSSLEQALLYRVAACVYAGMNGELAAIKHQQFMANYEMEVAQLELANTLNSSIVEDRSDRIAQGGWA